MKLKDWDDKERNTKTHKSKVTDGTLRSGRGAGADVDEIDGDFGWEEAEDNVEWGETAGSSEWNETEQSFEPDSNMMWKEPKVKHFRKFSLNQKEENPESDEDKGELPLDLEEEAVGRIQEMAGID